MQDDDDPLPASQGIGQDFREVYISSIIETIECANFTRRNRNDEPNFTRKRKITFIHLIVLLTQTLSRSIQRELNSFFQKLKGGDFSLQEVTKSAFTQARAKLKPEAFLGLNRVGLESFYQHAPYLTWQGFRLLAVDGSTIVLPNHPTVEQEFGSTGFGIHADTPRSLARISLLYDVLNLTTLDAQIGRFDESERRLADRHRAFMQPGRDLLIMDRGYPTFGLLFELGQQGIDYCMRLQDSKWLEVRKMREEGQTDKVVQFQLGRKDQHLRDAYPKADGAVTCRVVIVPLPDGGTEVLCTSVLDKERLPYDQLATLYHYRWNIEEGYKLYKSRIHLEAFSGKTAQAIRQDFFAKVFMMSTAAVMAFPIEEKLKKEEVTSHRKHTSRVNKTNALSMIREGAVGIFLQRMARPFIKAFDQLMKATREIVRPGRKVPRKHRKKQPPSMNYKQL